MILGIRDMLVPTWRSFPAGPPLSYDDCLVGRRASARCASPALDPAIKKFTAGFRETCVNHNERDSMTLPHILANLATERLRSGASVVRGRISDIRITSKPDQ